LKSKSDFFFTNGVSEPPTMLKPRPLESFLSSILFVSVLVGDFMGDFKSGFAGDFPKDLVGDLESSIKAVDNMVGAGDFAGLI
jgi:hypothetical protein